MIWMGNDLSLINDWETYLKGIHLQHGLDILLRWTGALERTHVLPVVSACSYASLRDHVRDVAEVPESIPLSPLLPLGNAICSDVDSSPPPVSLSLPSPPSFLFSCVERAPDCTVELICDVLDCNIDITCRHWALEGQQNVCLCQLVTVIVAY